MVSASARSGASTAEQSGDLERPGDFNALLLAMAGHDLRQPLQVILNAYERLARHHTEGREREYIERGELAVAQLTKQLDHLVTALRLHECAGGGEPSPVQLGPLLVALCKENSDLAAEKAIDLCAMPTRAVVASDAVLLEGILRNLIHNALKYTPAGGRVLIGCRRRGAQICIEVHDTGVGIAVVESGRCLLRCMSQLLARKRSGSRASLCLLGGVERKRFAHCEFFRP